MTTAPRVARVVRLYERLDAARLDELADAYALDARFVDPFNDVTGRAAIRRVFEHMYATLGSPRFEVLEACGDAQHGFLLWNLHYAGRGHAATIHGATHLRFAADGRIATHHDYWDPARQLYEGVPALGALMRWLRRRASAGAG